MPAIVVACLATFRNLFSREGYRHKADISTPPGLSNAFLRGGGGRKKIRGILDSLTSMSEHSRSGYENQNGSTSDDQSVNNHPKRGAQHLDEVHKAQSIGPLTESAPVNHILEKSSVG